MKTLLSIIKLKITKMSLALAALCLIYGCTSTETSITSLIQNFDPCASLQLNSEELYYYHEQADNILEHNANATDYDRGVFQNPDYLPYYSQIFGPEIIKINFSINKTKNNQTRANKGELFFSRGYLFIKYTSKKLENSGYEMHNYVTKANGIYSWQEGATKGKIFKKAIGDTLGFLLYFIDPSAIMRNFYWSYQNDPQMFTSSKQNGLKKIMKVDTLSAYSGFALYENPLWLKEYYIEQSDSTLIFKMEKPRTVNCIPKKFMQLPENMEWKFSSQGLNSRQVYF